MGSRLPGTRTAAVGRLYAGTGWVASRVLFGQPVHLHETAMLYYALLLAIVGSQFLAVGLVAELIVAVSPGERASYSIREITNDLPATDDLEPPILRAKAG